MEPLSLSVDYVYIHFSRNRLLPDYSPEIETQLLLRVAEGDEQAFDQLFRAYYPRLLQFVSRLDSNEGYVDEVIQEAFIRVWISRDQLPGIANFKAWLFTIASRESIALIRRRLLKQKATRAFVQNAALVQAETPADIAQATELKSLIEQAINRMPAARQRIYRMSREEGLKPSEIAHQLHLSVQTVKNTLVTALHDIRAFLKSRGLKLTLIWVIAFLF